MITQQLWSRSISPRRELDRDLPVPPGIMEAWKDKDHPTCSRRNSCVWGWTLRSLDRLQEPEPDVGLRERNAPIRNFALGARSAGPLYGEARLQALADDINRSADAAMIFADSPNPRIRQKALEILAEAERRTGTQTNAVTGHDASRGMTVIVFRHKQVTRGEVLEEMRHLDYARSGHWNTEVPGFSAFQVRELDAAAYFRNLLREGRITQAEFDETIRNLAHHLNVTEPEALRILNELAP
jgi:hypothetical protein